MLEVIKSKRTKKTVLLMILVSLMLVGCGKKDKKEEMLDKYQETVDEYKSVEEVEDTPEMVTYNWSYYDELNDVADDPIDGKVYKAHNYTEPVSYGRAKEMIKCLDCGNEIVYDVVHEHTFNSWKPFDENSEKHYCTVCGESEMQSHTYDETPSTIIYNFDYSDHILETDIYECVSCKKLYTTKKDIPKNSTLDTNGEIVQDDGHILKIHK